MKTGRIKINTKNVEIKIDSEKIQKISGLCGVEIKDGILYYEMLETANDYDVMVALLNILLYTLSLKKPLLKVCTIILLLCFKKCKCSNKRKICV